MDLKNWKNLSTSEQAEILATRPGIEPPNGIVPNFDNPPTRNDIGISVATIFLLLVVVTGLLRLYSRVFVIRVFRLEDCESFLDVRTKASIARSVRLLLKYQISASYHMYVGSARNIHHII